MSFRPQQKQQPGHIFSLKFKIRRLNESLCYLIAGTSCTKMFCCSYKSFPHTYRLEFSHGAFFHSFHKGPFIGTDIGSICDHYLTNSSSLLRLFWCQTICFYFVVLVEKSKKKMKEVRFYSYIRLPARLFFFHPRPSLCLSAELEEASHVLFISSQRILFGAVFLVLTQNQLERFEVTKTRPNNIGMF